MNTILTTRTKDLAVLHDGIDWFVTDPITGEQIGVFDSERKAITAFTKVVNARGKLPQTH